MLWDGDGDGEEAMVWYDDHSWAGSPAKIIDAKRHTLKGKADWKVDGEVEWKGWWEPGIPYSVCTSQAWSPITMSHGFDAGEKNPQN